MRSSFDAYVAWACRAVIALNGALAVSPLVDHCLVVLGGLLWCVVTAFLVVGVLLPAFIGRVVGPFGRRNVMFMVAAVASSGLAFMAMSVLGGNNLGHCIA